MNELTYIGKVIATFGIKGELKVYTESDFISYRFRKDAKIIIGKEEYIIERSREHKNTVLMLLKGFDNINDVLRLVGLDIYANSNDVPPMEEDEYYVDDLIGLKVYNQHDDYLGIINDLIDLPQGVVLEIIDNDKRMLIPFVAAYIKDITSDKVIINEIEGMR